MRMSTWIRQHIAALRALLVLTVITGIAYPVAVFAVAQLPGLHDKAEGSLLGQDGRIVGSSLIGQAFTDGNGKALVQYFQSRPSSSGKGDGYDPTSTSFTNLGPESIVDTLDADPADVKRSLLSQVCARSKDIGEREGVSGARPFCTPGGVGAVLSVLGPRDARGRVTKPTKVVSINEACPAKPFLDAYAGVKVDCATPGEDYSTGQIVPLIGDAPSTTPVPPDAVVTSASGLDPHISPAYAALQVPRIAKARNISEAQVQSLVTTHTDGRDLGFLGEPRVNVLELNLDLDRQYPYRG
ncbi:potassium-transporting ATPase subunit C [Nocardia sp. CDC159]|uniref:Potassium-transporting ATPase KdpC subunit n=1 Tax=Nocardia pulmonis TaxID=2951408 RepID=A0A9X2IYE4_9NOCA|nr:MULTISPECIES: potassium-transporting ATPase subunit C [Nocardia]MCM6773831.1 potassium-transporting ATPase subunit C [Nocardia pulmonis]MCM6786718.1 potassium-transporting ATPase subunit C [Nocardia sp. CDC159]